MTNAKIISYFMLMTGLTVLVLGLGSFLTAQSAIALETAGTRALVGDVQVSLIEPDGLVRVDGMFPEADEFIESLKERFKLRVLAVYAEPDQWRDFVLGIAQKEPRPIPRLAIISVTTRMDGKSYDQKAAKKERRKLNNMVSLAINTRPLTAIFSNRANAKLREKLGVDLKFKYLGLGEFVGKFDENDQSVSYSVLASLSLYGRQSDNFVTATALRVGDKFVYLAWIDPDRSREGISLTKAKTLDWVRQMNRQNTPGA
ncbi:MAG: hypothetical protein LBE31_02015 [Deltaproteobacteria bacterium]|jgi:hypothetical protein|nr:hypothetical protein [Deltaproteobacteria bacterium]